jgi:hypothetical protein
MRINKEERKLQELGEGNFIGRRKRKLELNIRV